MSSFIPLIVSPLLFVLMEYLVNPKRLLRLIPLLSQQHLIGRPNASPQISIFNPSDCFDDISCSPPTTPDVDTCCLNHPSGHFLLTQFWDTSPPLGANDTWTVHGLWPDYCTGGFDQFCDEQRSRSAEEISQIITRASRPRRDGDDKDVGTHPGMMEFMRENWLSLDSRNANLWAHEWNKHGTCVSTLEPKCYTGGSNANDTTLADDPKRVSGDADVLDYFTHAILLFTTLPTYDFLAEHNICPSAHETYSLSQIQKAIRDSAHGFDATLKCRGNQLDEIWYHFLAKGSLRLDNKWKDGEQWDTWVPTDPDGPKSNCPAHGIRYLPKKVRGEPEPAPPHRTATRTHTSKSLVPTSTSTAKPFTGKGHLMVKIVSGNTTKNEDRYDGCLIRKGTWYAASSISSCATFTASDDVESTLERESENDAALHLFTLESRHAPCSFVSQTDERQRETYLLCDPNLTKQTIFSSNTTTNQSTLIYPSGNRSQQIFYADEIPRNTVAQRIWTRNRSDTTLPEHARNSDGDSSDAVGIEIEIHWVPL